MTMATVDLDVINANASECTSARASSTANINPANYIREEEKIRKEAYDDIKKCLYAHDAAGIENILKKLGSQYDISRVLEINEEPKKNLLFHALRARFLKGIELLIKNRIYTSSCYRDKSALWVAVKLNFLEGVKCIIDAIKKTSRQNNIDSWQFRDVFTLAIRVANIPILEFLLKEGAKIESGSYFSGDRSHLFEAFVSEAKSSTEAVRLLLSHKATVNEYEARVILEVVIREHNLEKLKCIIDLLIATNRKAVYETIPKNSRYESNALCLAAKYNFMAGVQFLLKCGMDPNGSYLVFYTHNPKSDGRIDTGVVTWNPCLTAIVHKNMEIAEFIYQQFNREQQYQFLESAVILRHRRAFEFGLQKMSKQSKSLENVQMGKILAKGLQNGWATILTLLPVDWPDMRINDGEDNKTALVRIVSHAGTWYCSGYKAYIDIGKYLLNLGANPFQPSPYRWRGHDDYRVLFQDMIVHGHPDLVQAVIDNHLKSPKNSRLVSDSQLIEYCQSSLIKIFEEKDISHLGKHDPSVIYQYKMALILVKYLRQHLDEKECTSFLKKIIQADFTKTASALAKELNAAINAKDFDTFRALCESTKTKETNAIGFLKTWEINFLMQTAIEKDFLAIFATLTEMLSKAQKTYEETVDYIAKNVQNETDLPLCESDDELKADGKENKDSKDRLSDLASTERDRKAKTEHESKADSKQADETVRAVESQLELELQAVRRSFLDRVGPGDSNNVKLLDRPLQLLSIIDQVKVCFGEKFIYSVFKRLIAVSTAKENKDKSLETILRAYIHELSLKLVKHVEEREQLPLLFKDRQSKWSRGNALVQFNSSNLAQVLESLIPVFKNFIKLNNINIGMSLPEPSPKLRMPGSVRELLGLKASDKEFNRQGIEIAKFLDSYFPEDIKILILQYYELLPHEFSFFNTSKHQNLLNCTPPIGLAFRFEYVDLLVSYFSFKKQEEAIVSERQMRKWQRMDVDAYQNDQKEREEHEKIFALKRKYPMMTRYSVQNQVETKADIDIVEEDFTQEQTLLFSAQAAGLSSAAGLGHLTSTASVKVEGQLDASLASPNR